MKKSFVFSLFVVLIIFISCKKTTTDDDNPFPPATLDFSAIEKVLDDSVPARFGNKCYTVIHVNGQTAFSKGYGGYTGSTIVLIASCSKWLSGAVLMSMVDEGKLKLEDSVGKYLPQFTVYGKGKITIGQLFSHTSGLPGNSPQGYESDQSLTLAQAVDSIAKNVALISTPGTQFYYGGCSMQVAGRICEVVSAKGWQALFKQKLADPVGMPNTNFGLTANPILAGGGRSTANDYILFLDMLMRKGVTENGTRVLSEASVAAMEESRIGGATTTYTPYPPSLLTNNSFYGIGNWRDLVGPGDVLIENSSPGAFGSHPWINRAKKLTAIVFTFILNNGDNGNSPAILTCFKVRDLARTIVP